MCALPVTMGFTLICPPVRIHTSCFVSMQGGVLTAVCVHFWMALLFEDQSEF